MLITLHAADEELVVSTIGATIMSWISNGVSLIDGYLDEDELRTLDGYRSAVLAPWSNRIHDGKWDDDGTIRAVVDAGNTDPEGLHGLVFDSEFEVVEQSDSSIKLSTAIEPSAGYPYEVTLHVTYTLEERGLVVEIEARNDSDSAAPIGLGWHPYFYRSETGGEYAITGTHYVNVDEVLVPTAEPFVAFDGFGESIPDLWDNAITGVDQTVEFPVRGGKLSMTANLATEPLGMGVWHVFSGSMLKRGKFESIAVEPCTAMGDALNRLREHMLVAPGETATLTTHVVYSPASAQ